MSKQNQKKPSQTKTPDEKSHPRRSFEQYFFAASIVLCMVSLGILGVAQSIVHERTHVPFGGVALNKPITMGRATVIIKQVAHKPGTAQFAAPRASEYIVLTVSVKNISEEPINVSPSIDTYIKTSAGKTIYLTPYELGEPFHSGVILPGESTEGELSYLVPKTGRYKFYVEASWSGGVIPFMVQSEHKTKSEI